MYKWDEMTGLKRDVLIATKVMELPEPEYSTINGKWIHHFIRETYPGSGKFKEFTDEQKALSHYSTDISAAWEVVQKTIHSKPDTSKNEGQFYFRLLFNWRGVYIAKITQLYSSSEYVSKRDDLAEALCLVCLRAAGVDIE